MGDECIGIGVFADENIKAGTVMREGRFGVNMVIFNRNTNYPNTKSNQTLEHLKNWAFVCPCHVEGGGDDMMVYIPGSGINHRVNGNTRQVCRCDGVDQVSVRDIPKGEPLGIDYNSFGCAPKWHLDALKETFGTEGCLFRGLNDFVSSE